MANRHESTNDILRVFESEITVAHSTTAISTGDNVSSVLGEINTNNFQDDDLLQILNSNNNGQRGSQRRSSILKMKETVPEIRRNSRRVSWAHTFQFKELRSDGTMVITSQELNKYGPEQPAVRKSVEFEKSQVYNENTAPNAQMEQQAAPVAPSTLAPCSTALPVIDDPVQEQANREVMQKVKEKVKNNKSFTRILSKYYNKEDEKDCQTVINTAVNRFGLDIDPTTTDLNRLFDPANPNKQELLPNSTENANLNNFLQQFVEQQQLVLPSNEVPVTASASGATKENQLPNISPIAGNIKTNLHIIDDTMNSSCIQQICNSTRIGVDQPSPEEYWTNLIKGVGDVNESMCDDLDKEKGTIHDTTMMAIDMDSSESNEKVSKSAIINSQTQEVMKDHSAFLAMLKGTADDGTEMATDTLEFSFQLQQPSTNTKPQSLPATFNDQANNSNKENGRLDFNQLKNAVSQEVTCQSMQDSDILNILPSGTEQPPTDTRKMDTLVLPGDLTFGNILDSEAVPSTTTVTTASSSRSSGLTMEFTDVIEGTLENASNGNGFSVFNDATTVDETLVNASKSDPLLPEILPSSSNAELSVGGSQKENAVPSQFATANQQSDETSEFTVGLTMDITTSEPEIVNPLIQQLVAAQEVNKQSMNPSIDVSVVDTASVLSISQDPTVMPSPDKVGQEVNHSNEKSKLDFSLSDSMVDSQKENQIPFHRFQEKTKEPAESETQAGTTMKEPTMGVSIALTMDHSLLFTDSQPEMQQQAGIPTLDISMAATTHEPHTSMEITSDATLAGLLGSSTAKFDVSMALDDDAPVEDDTIVNQPDTTVENFMRVMASDKNSLDLLPKGQQEKSRGDSVMFPMNDMTLEMSTAPVPVPPATTGLFTNLLAGNNYDDNNQSPSESFNSTLNVDANNSLSSLLKDNDCSLDRSGLSQDLSQLPDIKVEVYEITKNMDTDEMATGESGCQQKMPYAPTRPFLGKSASTILDEEMEFTDSVQGTFVVSNQSIDPVVGQSGSPNSSADQSQLLADQKAMSPEADVPSNAKTEVQMNLPELPNDEPSVTEEAVGTTQPEEVPKTAVESPKQTIISPPSKRPYDFTMLDSQAVQEQQPTFAKRLSITPATSNTASMRTVAFPLANFATSQLLPPSSVSRSRIPVAGHRPTVVASSSSTISLRSFSGLSQICPLQSAVLNTTLYKSTSNNQRTTTLLSSTAKPITTTTITKIPTGEGLVKKQIELDFNQSRNASMNKSGDNSRNMSQSDSVFLNSPNFSTLLVKNCVRKSIGFGLKDRLIQKAQELNLQREKEAKQQQNSTVNNTTETHLIEHSTRESTKPIEAPIPEVAAPAPVAADNQTENVTKNESAAKGGTTSMDCTDQSMALDDGAEVKRFSVKLRSSGAPMEQVAEVVQPEEDMDEAEKGGFNISNFSMPNISQDSDNGTNFRLDDFEDEMPGSNDVLTLGQMAAEDDESSSEMNQLIEAVSQSIQNATVNDEESSNETLPLNETASPLNSTGYVIKRILDDTCEITKYELMNDLSLLSTESLEDFQSITSNDSLYRCISSLDFTSLHIRIHEMNPNTCVVRFLWGTLEVRINFGEIIKEEQNGSQVREMTFHTISMLPSNKEIPYEVMRGLKERARYDGDEMFLRYREEHRPLLQLAHSYITNRFHEECRDLIKKYPDSSKLLDLLHNLSNIVDTARKMCVELRHMYSRERMQLLAPDSEGRFRFSVKLLGVRLCSQFEVQFTFDPMKYPYEVIHPEIVVPELDQQLYPLGQFKAALLMVKPGNFNYLTSLIQGARFFVCALRKVLLANLKQQKQKAEIRAAKLLD